jgi:hypothetical protein
VRQGLRERNRGMLAAGYERAVALIAELRAEVTA